MKDAEGRIIYIGKAISLKKRVKSYFTHSAKAAKQELLVASISDIDFIKTQTEAEALILEAGLIKEYKPKFNVDIKDDKAYPLLEVSTYERYPRLRIVRRKRRNNALYFGPYTSAKLLRQAVSFLRRIFPLRVCNVIPKSACLNYHLKQCLAPCAGYVDEHSYKRIVDNLVLFLKGKKADLINKLSEEMKQAAALENFEQALELRQQIESLSSVPVVQKRYSITDQLEDLKAVLRLQHTPDIIEGYDISNISGKEAVGSMVRFKNGHPFKKNYRRFKIRTVKGIDDYAMIKEVLKRRFTGSLAKELELPGLILIDGGKGHLQSAVDVLRRIKRKTAVASLAKRNEYVYVEWQNKPLALPLNSKALRLLVSVRNEAHRFALKFHRNLRKKQMLCSELDQIPGIGEKRRNILVKYINSIDSLKKLNLNNLRKIRGIDEKTAKNIIEHWKKY
jgi:excinuclease ABC subunit C